MKPAYEATKIDPDILNWLIFGACVFINHSMRSPQLLQSPIDYWPPFEGTYDDVVLTADRPHGRKLFTYSGLLDVLRTLETPMHRLDYREVLCRVFFVGPGGSGPRISPVMIGHVGINIAHER